MITTCTKRSKNLGKLRNKEFRPIIIVRIGTKITIRIITKTTTKKIIIHINKIRGKAQTISSNLTNIIIIMTIFNKTSQIIKILQISNIKIT